MTPRYRLKIVTDFSSAHRLIDYPGECQHLHGHNWKLEVEVGASLLDKIGMAIDFKAIKNAARELSSALDHKYLNDLPPFQERNPTAENIAAWFFTELSKQLNNNTVTVDAVTLWETDNACVRYSED